jgi:hypothetical protein
MACDFLLEIELNTIPNMQRRLFGSDRGQWAENLHGINVQSADLGRFDGQGCAE